MAVGPHENSIPLVWNTSIADTELIEYDDIIQNTKLDQGMNLRSILQEKGFELYNYIYIYNIGFDLQTGIDFWLLSFAFSRGPQCPLCAPRAPRVWFAASMPVLPDSWHQSVQRIAAAAECDSQGMVLVVSGIVVGAGLGPWVSLGQGPSFGGRSGRGSGSIFLKKYVYIY